MYGYDSYHHRVYKVSLYETSWYGYDGWRLMDEYDGGYNGTVSYFDGNGLDEHLGLSRFDGIAWRNYAFTQDQLGNITRVLGDQGTTVARFEYDAYGKRTLVQGSPSFNITYGFTGRYHDAESGLLYYRNRYYSPGIGRFLTVDPLGAWPDSFCFGNAYCYTGESPTVRRDSSGLKTYLFYGFNGRGGDGLLGYVTPGTNADPTSAMDDLAKLLTDKYGLHDVSVHHWDDADKVFKDIVSNFKENPDDPIRLAGHSRGEAAVMAVLWRIYEYNQEVRARNRKQCKKERLIKVRSSMTLDQFWQYHGGNLHAVFQNLFGWLSNLAPNDKYTGRDGIQHDGVPSDEASGAFPGGNLKSDIVPPGVTQGHIDLGSDPSVNYADPIDLLGAFVSDRTPVANMVIRGQTHTSIDDWITQRDYLQHQIRSWFAR